MLFSTLVVEMGLYIVCNTQCRILHLKMREAGLSKCKNLLLSNKILIIEEVEKKSPQKVIAKKFGISQHLHHKNTRNKA